MNIWKNKGMESITFLGENLHLSWPLQFSFVHELGAFDNIIQSHAAEEKPSFVKL